MTADKKHILIVTSEFPPLPGGIGNHAFNLAKQLTNLNYNITVLTDQRTRDKEEIEFDSKLNFKIERVPLRRLRPLMYIDRLYNLYKLMGKQDLTIASGKFSLWSVSFYSRFKKTPTMAVLHGTEVNFTNPLLKKSIDTALRQFDQLIAVSNYTKNLIKHLKLSNIEVIPNGFDPADWNTETDHLPVLLGSPKLITVGNVTNRKGQLNVIKLIPTLLKDFPHIHYHCVGYPTEAEDFTKEAKRLLVDDHISFHGRTKHDELQGFLSQSDIFVMLSSATKSGDVEGFGIAILEANYLGIPAIGSLGCGIEDAIQHNSTGFLIQHDNAKAMTNAIKVLLNNIDQYSNAAKIWAEKHSWEHIVQQYKTQIDSI